MGTLRQRTIQSLIMPMMNAIYVHHLLGASLEQTQLGLNATARGSGMLTHRQA